MVTMALPRLPGLADAPSKAIERGANSADMLSIRIDGAVVFEALFGKITMPLNFLAS